MEPLLHFPRSTSTARTEIGNEDGFFLLFSFFLFSFPLFLCGLEYVPGGNESTGNSRSTKIHSLVSQNTTKNSSTVTRDKTEEINGVDEGENVRLYSGRTKRKEKPDKARRTARSRRLRVVHCIITLYSQQGGCARARGRKRKGHAAQQEPLERSVRLLHGSDQEEGRQI